MNHPGTPLGHFHGDVQVGRCCCPLEDSDQPGACPQARWSYCLSDVGHGNVGSVCDVCHRPLCTPGVLAQARRGADWSDTLIGEMP